MTKLSNGIEPSIKSFLEDSNSQGGPQIFELSVKEARKVLLNVQDIEVNKLPADIEDLRHSWRAQWKCFHSNSET